MKKKIIALIWAAVTAISLMGCGNTNTNTQEAAETQDQTAAEGSAEADTGAEETANGENTYRYTFVSPLVSHEYWIDVEEGIQAGAKEQGVDVAVLGDTKVDVDAMVKYIDTAIASKVDGIITMALSPAAIGPAIDRAVDAGIPVVLVDTDAPESKRAAYVGTSNYDAGYEAGKAMIEATGGKAKIGIIRGTIGQETDNDRIKGFEDAIKDEPDMEILTTEACNSDMLTVAAGKVLEEQGLSGTITVIGWDDTDECLDFIRTGVVKGTIVQKPDFMGRKAVELLTRINNGEELTETVIDSGVTFVTAENVDTYKDAQ